LVLIAVFITGCSSALLTGATLGLSALFPASYTAAVMTGMGLGGLISIGLRVITKLALSPDAKGTEKSAIIFFALAAFIILLCIGSFIILSKAKYAQFFIEGYKGKQTRSIAEEQNPLLDESEHIQPTFKEVFRKLWMDAGTVFSVFFVTLSLFPGITGLIPNTIHTISTDWFQIIMLGLFMVGDFIGRIIPKWICLFQSKSLKVVTFIRVVFFALFIICIKLEVNGSIPLVTMFIFSFTNGHCSTLAMMYGPSNVQIYVHEKELAGTIMSFFLQAGIFVGSHFALLLLYIINGSLSLA